MDSILVKGGNRLNGSVVISGAKNAALPDMCAALLTDEDIILKNAPRLVDIETMHKLLQNHGCVSEWDGDNQIRINASNITSKTAPYDIVRKMRASIWVLGPLLARFGEAKVSMPGGCAIGARMIDQHIEVMKALGADVKIKDGYIYAKCDGKLKGADFLYEKVTVGGTINGILAAVLAEGETRLSNCCYEPEIRDLCLMLNKMGAKISGYGTSQLIIQGVEKLAGCTHEIIGDRIVAGTYIAAVGITGGEINLKNIDYDLFPNLINSFKLTGLKISKISQDEIKIIADNRTKSHDISTAHYPGFHTDLQAQYMAMMTVADGSCLITENIFENRFMHVPELMRMGANIKIDGHSALVKGVDTLKGAEVMASDLRASSSLILAALGAEGESKIRRVYHLDRGYEKLEANLSNMGAEIERVKGDSV